MIEFTLWDIVRNLLLAARWTVVLSLIAFIGGATVGLVLTFMRLSSRRWLQRFTSLYVDLFQGTPLLMQLFLIFLYFFCTAFKCIYVTGGWHFTTFHIL